MRLTVSPGIPLTHHRRTHFDNYHFKARQLLVLKDFCNDFAQCILSRYGVDTLR